jgi:virginiamycin B lyase
MFAVGIALWHKLDQWTAGLLALGEGAWKATRKRRRPRLTPARRLNVYPAVEQLEKRWLLSSAFTEYALAAGSKPLYLTLGSDNNVWYTDNGTDKIGSITPTGTITEYANGTFAPYDIMSVPGGNLWFTESTAAVNAVGTSTTAGSITNYTIPNGHNNPQGIASTLGPDGNLWLVLNGSNQVAKATTAGSFTFYTIPTNGSAPVDIVAAPDGLLYFTESQGNKIGSVSTSGTFSEYTIPTASSSPQRLTVGPDGNIYFTESANGANKIGRLSLANHQFSEYTIPTGNSNPQGIVTGPDNRLWFAESANTANKLAAVPLPEMIAVF